MFWRFLRRPQRVGIRAGVFIGIIFGLYLWTHNGEALRVRGPMTVGHQDTPCIECHQEAPGSIRQQLQAKVRYWLNERSNDVSFGYKSVRNADCMACHERPDDRHPTYRFLEPRFAEARAAIVPQSCRSCHFEHTGNRVGVEPSFCRHCHQETEYPNDSIEPTHATLAFNEEWNSCMQCHDFHGNHKYKTPNSHSQRYSLEDIETYFQGGESPYGKEKSSPAQDSRSN